MPKVLTQKEVDDLLDALANTPAISFSEEDEKVMNINIICKGFAEIPFDAKHCPVCGKAQYYYTLENMRYANPADAQGQCCIVDFAQKYPTFICDNCHTIWQYLGEKEEEKENE